MIFGVVTASASSVEQQRILNGIIEQAKEYNVDVAILSNIYNPNDPDNDIYCENMIYELIDAPVFDGIILISESFMNSELQQTVRHYLLKKDVPIVIIGTYISALDFPNVRFINTSDVNDIMDVTNHLLDEHDYKDIALLTGYQDLEASHLRIEGYRMALENHGIAFDEKKVYYGDFWMSSGEELARKFISGALPFPEAIVCANDYMAYGIFNEFEKNGLSLSDKLAVIGYENSGQRHLYTPVLTTYQRNRKSIGKSAVQIIFEKVRNHIDIEFSPPKGTLVCGTSCRCSFSNVQLHNELKAARIQHDNNTRDLFSTMPQRLTSCNTLDDFIRIMSQERYLIRFVQNIYLCLYENWYELENNTRTENMIVYDILMFPHAPFHMAKNCFSEMFKAAEQSAAYYFSPLFFHNKSFGFIVLEYNEPETYDDIFRNWQKSISNGLAFLCMKNDIRYLTQCQDLSETKDSLTALNNNKGLEKAFHALKAHNKNQNIFFVMLKICLFSDDFSDFDKKKKIASLLDAADAVRQFCGNRSSICGRINDTVFGCFIQTDQASCEQLTDNLNAIITQHKTYLTNYGMDSFICCAVKAEEDDTYSEICKRCTSELEVLAGIASEIRNKPHYNKMLKIRNDIYISRNFPDSTEEICQRYSYSPGHLRSTYKNCFNISFHKDCINSRISMAKYLLSTTNMTVTAIAEQCGYDENKHFMHQFKKVTGITPNMYRNNVK